MSNSMLPGVAFDVSIIRAFRNSPEVEGRRESLSRVGMVITMNLIGKLLPPANVVLDLEASSKKRVFEQAGLLFENNQGLARSKVFDSLFARERLGSTGLGQQVAIPHGRIKGLRDPVAAFIRLADPIPFDAPDGRPVAILVFLMVPEQATQAHLEILSELAQMLSDTTFREMLSTAPDAGDVHRHLVEWEPFRPAA